MDACDEILKKDEVDSYELNEKKYGQVLEDFFEWNRGRLYLR